MATVKRRGWATDWGKDFSDVHPNEVRNQGDQWLERRESALVTPVPAWSEQARDRLVEHAQEIAIGLYDQASEMERIAALQPPADIAHLEYQVRLARPDLDIYWEPEFLEGSHGELVSWSLNADEPNGQRFATITFDTLDQQVAEEILAEDPSAASLYGQVPPSGFSNYETYRVATDVFSTDYGAAYREAVVETNHGGPGGHDLYELTGVDVAELGHGPEGLRDFIENPPAAHAAEIRRLTESVDLSRVNWQELYDHQVEEAGLAGFGEIEARQQARQLGVHQLEGRIIGAEVRVGEYLSPAARDELVVHESGDYQLQELNQAGWRFVDAAKTIPSGNQPAASGLEQAPYIAPTVRVEPDTGIQVR